MDSEFTTDDTTVQFTMPLEDFFDLLKERNRLREALQDIVDLKGALETSVWTISDFACAVLKEAER